MKPQLATIKPEQVSRAKTKSDLVLEEVIRRYEKEKKNILKKELFDAKANYAFRIKVPTLSPT